MSAKTMLVDLPRRIHGLLALYVQITTPVSGGVGLRLRERGLPDIANLAKAAHEQWDEALEIVLEHGLPSRRIRLDVTGIDEGVETLIGSLEPGQILTLSSACELVGQSDLWHLPMIDFNCRADLQHREFTRHMLSREGLRGFLLDSSQSFHFCGIFPQPFKAWFRFLGRLLLLPYIDTRHLGHRVIDCAGSLRITATAGKPDPVVVIAP